jgi:hypothetical protein
MFAHAAKIQDYAVIGDGRSAALISNRGSRFDSASVFAAILDPKIGGAAELRAPAQTRCQSIAC